MPRRGRSFFSTNRVCSRCLALKDTIVGYTDEVGVTIPPLHPRCRCAIIYDEVAEPRTAKPKPKLVKPEAETETKPTPVINPLLIPATAPVVSPNPKPNNPSENVTTATVKPLIPTVEQPETVSPQEKPDEDKIHAKLEETRAKLKIKGEIKCPPPKLDFSDFTFDAAHTQGDKHPHDVTEEEAHRFLENAYFAIYFSGNNSMNYFGHEGAAYVQLGKKKFRTAFKTDEYNPKFKKMIEVYENEQSQRESSLPLAEERP